MTARAVGTAWAFLTAVLVIAVWAVTGPLVGFSSNWQLWINTATTITTVLMVFLIQNTQNRDARALHLKLDELIRATPGAHREVMDVEEEDIEEIERERRIVDRADPTPPEEQPDEARTARPETTPRDSHGNGKPRAG